MTAVLNGQSHYQLIGPSAEGDAGNLLAGMEQKAAKLRLQALISEWLRMENLVVLTGAGTSVTCGGKIMTNLESAVLSTIEQLSDLPKSIKAVIANRKEKKTPGLEEWLSYVVNAQHLGAAVSSPFSGVAWRDGASPTQEELNWFIEQIGKTIFSECALTLPDLGTDPSPSKIPPHLAFLSKLVARDSNLGRVHLFTLNYDTLYEQAAETLGIQYFDGFTGRALARFDPAVYGLDVYYPGDVAEGRVRRFDKFMHFYKLHGSIHWQVFREEIRARHPDLTPFQGYGGLDPKEKAKRLPALFKGGTAIGILPTANKFAQTLTMPFAHIFRSFQIRLSAPQTFLMVLGYGFGDEHVNRIIDTALMNPSIVMLVVEPNPKSPTIERIKQYKELGKRAFILTPTQAAFDTANWVHASFDDFARAIMPDVQWLDDFLKLRRFEKQISAAQPLAEEPSLKNG